MKQRDISIDILRFFAALLITNSHIGGLYPEGIRFLSTGGAIGDVLFFFCSGYTLFMGRGGSFFNWYKRRINRIYPTVFAWAILAAFIFGIRTGMDNTILSGGGWFVSCIMVYYMVFFWVRWLSFEKYPQKRMQILKGSILGIFIISVVVYLLFGTFSWDVCIYGDTKYKWILYSMYMLFGAMIGVEARDSLSGNGKTSVVKDIALLFACVVVYYVFAGFKYVDGYEWVQLFSMIPLFGVPYYFWKVCRCGFLTKCYAENRILRPIMATVSGLCLEIYIVQHTLLSCGWFEGIINALFPLNIIAFFTVIVIAAYIVRCGGRIFSQTFGEGDYRWSEVFKVY